MNAAEILVIILSIFLAIFLAVAIALGVLLIKVTLQIKKVTATAERTADNIEQMTAGAKRATSKLAIGKIALSLGRILKKRRR